MFWQNFCWIPEGCQILLPPTIFIKAALSQCKVFTLAFLSTTILALSSLSSSQLVTLLQPEKTATIALHCIALNTTPSFLQLSLPPLVCVKQSWQLMLQCHPCPLDDLYFPVLASHSTALLSYRASLIPRAENDSCERSVPASLLKHSSSLFPPSGNLWVCKVDSFQLLLWPAAFHIRLLRR